MRIIDRLITDVFESEYFRSLFLKCATISAEFNLGTDQATSLDTKELHDALRFADILSNATTSESRNKAYQLITYLNTRYSEDPYYRTVAKAVYSKLGNFPAISFLVTENNNNAELPFVRTVEMESKRIIQEVPDSDGLVFTDSQYELFTQLSNTLEYSFSGPTSMGKSFIIKAFIKKVMRNSPRENLVIIVPTRALINQFALDIREEFADLVETYKYNILTNSSVSDLVTEEKSNYIFVLTPERLISYLSQDSNPPIGFIFLDEAHKLANEKDSRSVTTYTSIEKALKKYGNIKLYFSSPNVSNPEVFLKLFNRNTPDSSYQTDESPVSQNLFFLDLINQKVSLWQDQDQINIPINGFLSSIESTEDLIYKIGRGKNNLVYCNSKAKTIQRAQEFAKKLKKEEQSTEIRRAIRQVKEYIHPDYYLAELLEHKTAFHYGKLPQLIRNLVEDLYKEGEIKNVFCTSTLLEGVNMPTQNIFILENKNGHRKLDPIDFWNLSGRAGRLSKELAGNIFCVQYDSEWKNKEILRKRSITLKPTVITKIDRNLTKIEKVLQKKNISGTQEEQHILKYIANIISVDTLEIDANYESPVIKKLIQKNKEKIIEQAKENTKGFQIPKYILSFNQSINLEIQNEVFTILKNTWERGGDVRLPSSSPFKYDTCLAVLQKMYRLYKWGETESRMKNEKSLKYFAMLMNKWVNGFSLSQMIKQSIDWYQEKNRDLFINRELVPFQRGNKEHINHVIEKIIDDIESILRFLFEKYFNHYHQVVIKLLGEENAGENWASLLEYGTQNRIVIALQNIGLSRNTALIINNKHKSALTIVDGKLQKVNKQKLLQVVREGSLEHREILRAL